MEDEEEDDSHLYYRVLRIRPSQCAKHIYPLPHTAFVSVRPCRYDDPCGVLTRLDTTKILSSNTRGHTIIVVLP